MRSGSWVRLAATACAAAMVGAAGPALAQSGSSSLPSGLKLSGDQPIQIESDKLEVHQDQSLAIFSGNVNVVQGPTVMKAGTMKVYYVKSAEQTGNKSSGAKAADTKAADTKAVGGPALAGTSSIDHLEVDDKVYIKSNDQVATGDKGTFDMKSQVLVLSGDKVVLSQGPNVLVGCKLTVQMATGLAQVDGCPVNGSGGRVMMSLTPNSAPQQP